MSSLQFVYGPASRDHQTELVKQLFTDLQNHPQDQFFFLVPNHIKFSTEIDVLNQLRQLSEKKSQDGQKSLYVQSRVQILSFSRLAWLLLRDQPAYQVPRISNVGMTMLVAKIMDQLPASDMAGFAKEAQQPGFMQELTKQLQAFENGCIDPDDADQIMTAVKNKADSQTISRAFQEKMDVLFKIYREFHAGLAGHQQTSSIYEMLVAQLEHDDFSHTHFYLNRFNGEFTARELQLVEAMIKNGASTMIGMVSDHPYSKNSVPDVNNLYAATGQQYERLAQFARQVKVPILPDIEAQNVRVAKDIQEVEKWMDNHVKFTQQSAYPDFKGQVHFFTAGNQVDELSKTAAIIRQLVATGDYRYQDFLIMTRHLDGYTTMIDPVFKANDIPIFNDNDQSMSNHPLVTLLDGLFKLAEGDYSLSTVMQLLKTELLFPAESKDDNDDLDDLMDEDELAALVKEHHQQFLDQVYNTENWCLKFGRGKYRNDWCSEKTVWHNDIHDQGPAINQEDLALNQVRDYVKDVLAPVGDQLAQAKTGEEAARTLYQALESLHITDRLHEWAQEASDAGDLQQAQAPQQVWRTFASLLDEYVEILGGVEHYSLDQFAKLMMIGFQTATYSQIPSTMDQVLISETGITQTNDRKVVFMIGSTDDVMPETRPNDGLLDDDDLQLLNKALDDLGNGQYLPAAGLKRLSNEPLVNCLGMMCAQEQLYLSAPLMGADEEQRRLSPYLVGLASHFGLWDDGKEKLKDNLAFAPQANSDFTAIWPFITAPMATLSNYARALAAGRSWQGRAKVGAVWRQVARMLNGSHMRLIQSGYHYRNQTTNLSPDLAMKLYGSSDPIKFDKKKPPLAPWQHNNTLRASISQLQTYYRNPYEYFLKYGLHLDPREELSISTARSGVFYHDTMEKLIRDTGKTGATPINKMDRQTLDQAVNKAMQWAFDRQPELNTLKREPRFNYQRDHLQQVARAMAHILQLQAGHSHAQITTTEQQFGNPGYKDDRHDKQGSWDALIYPADLDNPSQLIKHPQRKVYVRGRIDRVDTVQVNQQDYFNVIDYKSSNHKFNLTTAYAGLDLQLLTYLNSLRKHLEDDKSRATIGGALYLQLSMPHYSYSDYLAKGRSEIELASHPFKGLLLKDTDYLTALDTGLDSNQRSTGDLLQVNISLGRHKKSEPAPVKISAKVGSLLVDSKQLDGLLDRNRDLITKAAKHIFAGQIALRPYRLDQQTGLEHSDYLDIFTFDNVLDQQKFRDLNKQEAEKWLEDLSKTKGSEK